MKSTFFSFLTATAIISAPIAGADQTVATKKKPVNAADKVNVIWQNDPLCQFVFFAVLEGLYRDGVQDEAVDLVLGRKVDLDEKVKHCFVFKCELCHAVYEAFALYKARPPFKNTEGKTTFGKGVDSKVIEELKSEDVRTRIYAMGGMIRPWIQHRVEQTRMTVEEQTAMKKKFEEYTREGRKLLSEHRGTDKVYLDWVFYGTCQACEAAKDFKLD